MPRAKRILAEADANAEAVAPVAKRASLGKSQKENDKSGGAGKGGESYCRCFTMSTGLLV